MPHTADRPVATWRLLFLVKSIASEGGGAEKVLSVVASALARRGHAVTVASFDPQGTTPFYPYDARVQFRSLHQGVVDQPATVADALRRIPALRRLLDELRPDCAIGFLHSSYVFLAMAAVGTGARLIGSEHTVQAHYAGRPVEWALLRATSWRLAAMTAVSEAMKRTFPASMQRRMTVIPNPVDVQSFQEGQAVTEKAGRPRLLCVAGLRPEKDLSTLVEAFARIAPAHPDWDLRIVGEGAMREALEAQVAAAGLAGRVSLPGSVRDISREYACASAFVLPSLYESQGLALAEALTAGLPSVGFAACDGVRDLIEDGRNGLLASDTPDRVSGLAVALGELLSNDERRSDMALSARDSVRVFDVERIAAQWEALIARVIARAA